MMAKASIQPAQHGAAAQRHGELSFGAAVEELAYALSHPVRHWWRCRRTCVALERLRDDMLEDIGVDSLEIPAAARAIVGRNLPRRQSVQQAFGNVVVALRRDWLTWRIERATLRDLSRLDDRMLRDIGLDRGMIGVMSASLGEMVAARAAATVMRPRFVEDAPAGWAPAYDDDLPKRVGHETSTGETANDNALRRAS